MYSKRMLGLHQKTIYTVFQKTSPTLSIVTWRKINRF